MEIDMAQTGFEQVCAKDSPLEKIASGFQFTEGPVWSRREGVLRFSDIPSNRIHQWDPRRGLSVYREGSARSNGLTYDPQGRLIACEHVGRRISRTELDGTLTTLAILWEGKRLNSPNDVVCKSDGAVYFTDPDYGIKNERVGLLAPQEIPFKGVYRVSPDGKTLTCLVRDFTQPNGLAFSPDERILYVNDTLEGHIRAFDVRPDGSLANSRLFAKLAGEGNGRPDGMKVDSAGNVYCTGPGGIHVLDPNGHLLGRLRMPAVTANLAWGDDDWKTLYFTCQDSVYRLRMNITGVPVVGQRA